jgi:hypothetical protein
LPTFCWVHVSAEMRSVQAGECFVVIPSHDSNITFSFTFIH